MLVSGYNMVRIGSEKHSSVSSVIGVFTDHFYTFSYLKKKFGEKFPCNTTEPSVVQ
jgi:hypothetical protein